MDELYPRDECCLMIKLKENNVNDFHCSHAVIFIDFHCPHEFIFLLCFSFMLKYAH